MRTILIAATIAILALPARAEWCAGWDREDTWTAVAFGGAVAADLYTTRRALDAGGKEENPLLGHHPNDNTLALAGVGAVGGYLLGACLLSEPWRTRWGWFWIGAELGRAYHNHFAAIRITF